MAAVSEKHSIAGGCNAAGIVKEAALKIWVARRLGCVGVIVAIRLSCGDAVAEGHLEKGDTSQGEMIIPPPDERVLIKPTEIMERGSLGVVSVCADGGTERSRCSSAFRTSGPQVIIPNSQFSAQFTLLCH